MGYADKRVADAMRKVDRKDFVPDELRSLAYVDTPLVIGHEQTTSAPSIIASMLRSLEVGKGMNVLEVGTGSGYQTAILSELVGGKGSVTSIEIVPELVRFARANLAKYKLTNISLVQGSGAGGYAKGAPFDRIIYSAAATRMPQKAVGQLNESGKLIVPVDEGLWQRLYLVESKGGRIEIKALEAVVFVPLKE